MGLTARYQLCISTTFVALCLTAVRCQGQATTVTDIRLVAGSGNGRDGRVEIQYGAEWGTICDDGWTLNDSIVACRMAGFNPPSRNVDGGFYPPGADPMKVLLRAVQCYGTERSLADCPFQLNNGSCKHAQDAGVICLGDAIPTTTTTTMRPSTTTLPPKICDTPRTDVRLLTGDTVTTLSGQGRIQIHHNGDWREICSDMWGLQDAQVICRMLCFNPANARAVIGGQEYGNTTDGYWLSQVQCTGAELIITDCPHPGYGNTPGCDYLEPAGVSCVLDTPTLPPLPRPEVECGGESITAVFLRADDPNLLREHVTVSGPDGHPLNCYYTRSINATAVSISIPFIGNCSTARQVNETHVSYNNTVRYAVPSSTTITRTEVYYVRVLCVIPKNSDPGNGFDPEGRTVPPYPGDGTFDVRLMFFEDGSFQTPLGGSTNAPLKVTLGDWLYIGAQLYAADPNLKLVLSDCYVSASVQAGVEPQYHLIRNKCAVESTVTLYPINSTLSGFRFQSFRFVNASTSSTSMYLHCATLACALSETTGNCDPTCRRDVTGRSRRSDVTGRAAGGLAFDLTSFEFIVVPPADSDAPATASLSVSVLPSAIVVAVTWLMTSLLLWTPV